MLDREQELLDAIRLNTVMLSDWTASLEETKSNKGVYNKADKLEAIKYCEKMLLDYNKRLKEAREDYDNFLLNGSKGSANYGE